MSMLTRVLRVLKGKLNTAKAVDGTGKTPAEIHMERGHAQRQQQQNKRAYRKMVRRRRAVRAEREARGHYY